MRPPAVASGIRRAPGPGVGDADLGFNEAASRGQRIRISPRAAWPRTFRRTIAECRDASMRPPAVASGYVLETLSRRRCSEPDASMRPPAVASGYSPVKSESSDRQSERRFNEAASRGQRIRTNRKYPTRQRLRIVLRALPHHDHTRAVASSPARCGRCHHLSARTSSARAAPFKGFAHGTARHLRGCLDRA